MSTIFLDAEFTKISNMAKARLISIGLVSKTCGSEFYAEPTDTWIKRMFSAFVKKTVLPMLADGNRAVCKDSRMTTIE